MKKNKTLRIVACLYILIVAGLSLADVFLTLRIREVFGGAALVMLLLTFFSKVPLNTMGALPMKRAQDQAVDQARNSWISLKAFVVITLPLALAYCSLFI
ncbi:hypothetical protein [Holdemania filiformis]|uniref:hypothetical protein n=1 Tax=Holdemania filiformis TaxID=61171 RepID=UPI0022E1055E|nr:hypothetical protein [Holdemania filiformis]